MDRRDVLKGFGGVIGISGGLGSRPLLPTSPTEAAANAAMGSSEAGAEHSDARDIRKLSQQFKEVNGNTAPWIFVPEDNIKSLNTWEHPGYVTLRDARKGVDIKGILEKPIAIGDYPLPWEFHLGMVQAGLSTQHGNYALGLNLAVTFSDPSTWPKDRTQMPPDTHSLQLFVVHLNAPQLVPSALNYQEPGHEVYLLYGRGDLAPDATGNWVVPYTWMGERDVVWDRSGGPASLNLSFRVKIENSTQLQIGFTGGAQGVPHPGWRMKHIDLGPQGPVPSARFGRMTGIWQIGPIFSLDRWVPDVLAGELGIHSGPPLELMDPDTAYGLGKYLVDYGIFFGAGLENLDHMSDDFDDPLPMAKWYHEGNPIIEQYSHPGYLTATFMGTPLDEWGMCSTAIGEMIELQDSKPFPGYEMEMCFIPPEDTIPWNVYMSSIIMYDARGMKIGSENLDPSAELHPDYNWHPGVLYIPSERRHVFSNNCAGPDTEKNRKDPIFVEFEPAVPESILSHRPIFMLLQIIDSTHVRIGFKGNKTDSWYLSKPFDTMRTFGKIGKFLAHPCVTVSPTGGIVKGWGIGNVPRCSQVHMDYVHFRHGLTAKL